MRQSRRSQNGVVRIIQHIFHSLRPFSRCHDTCLSLFGCCKICCLFCF